MQKLKLHIELKKNRCLNCLRCYRFKNVNWSLFLILILNFPGGSGGKASVYNAGDRGSIPGLGRSPDKEMVTHSSILDWRIPWTEKPGWLQSTGFQRVGHD